jgi:transposase
MSRFLHGDDRDQVSLLPPSIDDYVDEDNPVRVIDAFVDALDLGAMGFDLVPAKTGRPAYHPGAMLKIYIYGYMNRVQSSRRLETECQRNLELMWLTGRLAPDFKTIADFRRDNGAAICAACGNFIAICRKIGMFTRPIAVVDGSRFKGVNARDKNFTRGKVKSRIGQVEEAIARYLRELDAADRHERMGFASDGARLRDKLTKLEAQMAMLKAMEAKVAEAEDHQVSLTDPDTRSMVTGLRLVGVVGYNVQTATDPEHHLIIAHEVTNSVTDRGLLPRMAQLAKDALGMDRIDVLADRGYFSSWDIYNCGENGVSAMAPRSRTGSSQAEGRFPKEAFTYVAEEDAYRCPAGELLTFRGHTYESSAENMKVGIYWTNKCGSCPLKPNCTTAEQRRIRRWVHEDVIEAMNARMAALGNAMGLRRQVAEHPYGTLKMWMGATPFLCKGLKRVRTEMSLSVLAYNIRRMISILGVRGLRKALA